MIVDNALTQWGSPANVFPAEVRAAYVESLRDQQHAHAICEEYRAADVRGQAIDGGHFFPEEKPEETVKMLREFLNR